MHQDTGRAQPADGCTAPDGAAGAGEPRRAESTVPRPVARDPQLASRRHALLESLLAARISGDSRAALEAAYEWVAAFPSDADVVDALTALLDAEDGERSGNE